MFKSLIAILMLVLLGSGCTTMSVENENERYTPSTKEKSMLNAPAPEAVAAGHDAARFFSPVKNRMVAFTARLEISSPNVSAALQKALEIAKKNQGYSSTLNDSSITLKIPFNSAEQTLAELETLGTVTSRQINAEDITDTIVDLQMRIDNAEKLHKSLSALAAKATSIKDILAVEKELSRVTGELERLKAMRKNAKQRVDFVTISLYFSTSASREPREHKFRLPQLVNLGLWNIKLSVTSQTPEPPPFSLVIPSGFIPVTMRNSNKFFAIDSNDTVISAMSIRQLPEADLKFWCSAITRELQEYAGYKIKSEVKTADNGEKYILFSGERMQGKRMMKYQASCRIIRNIFSADRLYIVEALGAADKVTESDFDTLHRSVK